MKKLFIVFIVMFASANLFAQTTPAYTSLAVGTSSVASGTNSFATGFSSQAAGINSIALGNSQAGGQYSFAMGSQTMADGNNSTAMGLSSRAMGDNSVSIGTLTWATGKNSLAMGSDISTNYKSGSFSFGDLAGSATYSVTTPFGNDADNQMLMRFAGGYKFFLTPTNQAFAINPNGTVNIDANNLNNGTVNSGLVFGNQSGEGIASKRTAGGNQYGLDFYSNFTSRMSITNLGKVGIGTTSPQQMLSIGGSMNIDQNNLNSGSYLQSALTFGSNSGEGIGSNRVGGVNQYGLDLYAGGINRLTIANGGNVGIGITSPTAKLQVAGNIVAIGTITPSDIRYKENIVSLDNALDKIMSLSGYYYSLKTNEFPDMGFDSKKQVGIIAQEVEEVLPEVVTTLQNGYKAVDYPKLIPLLIQGIKEQQQILEKQQKQIDELKKLVESLLKK